MASADPWNVAVADPEAEKARWLATLDDLTTRIEEWARALGWSTRRIAKHMSDRQIGDYVAPALLMQEELTRVMLEPIGRSVVGADGTVDLYLMPAYDDIARLLLVGGEWLIYPFDHHFPAGDPADATDEYEPRRLSRESIAEVLSELKAHGG